MKKNSLLFLIASAALIAGIAFSVCSCGKKSGQTEDSDTETVSVTMPDTELDETAPETEPVTEVKEELRVPVENERAEEIAAYQYEKASEIVRWVRMASMPADLSEPVYIRDIASDEETEADGESSYTYNYSSDETYYRVIDTKQRPELDGEPITSFALLKKYIKSVFARTIAEHLIDEAEIYYRDIDGVLCRTEPEEPIEDPAEDLKKEYFLSKFTDSLFRYTAKVRTGETDEDGNPVTVFYDFVFENTGSGWYWTQFPVIKAPETGAETEKQE
ncbi:MAG: hypothetical protein ACI4QZ_02130 [Eubacteriales bacterium]